MRLFLPTAYNSVFAVRFAHLNACSTSQTRKMLSDISIGDQVEKRNPQGVKKWNDKR